MNAAIRIQVRLFDRRSRPAGDAETRVVLGYTRRHPGEARFIKSAQLAFEEVATTDMAAREHTPRWSVTVMRGCR